MPVDRFLIKVSLTFLTRASVHLKQDAGRAQTRVALGRKDAQVAASPVVMGARILNCKQSENGSVLNPGVYVNISSTFINHRINQLKMA